MMTTAPETPPAMSLSTPPDTESPSPPPLAGARVPSLRTISDPSNTTPSSTPLGPLQAARQGPLRPPPSTPFARSGQNAELQARLRAFQQSRMNSVPNIMAGGMNGMPVMPDHSAGMSKMSNSPASPPGGINRMGPRPMAPPNWNSAPAIAQRAPKPSLGQRRGLKLPGGLPGAPPMPSGGPPGPVSSAALPNGNTEAAPTSGQDAQGSMFDKYSRFVDARTGSLKFAGKAVLHGKGVEFSSGSSFSISLDEVEQLEELGKGNYGTVYKVIHRRPSRIRRGSNAGLPTEEREASLNGTGVEMAMKEIRLELDENKFAQIIMELDVLHRCRSPYIIDFYGAFFQEGAVYICMEFMEGGSIDKLYHNGISEPVLKRIAFSTVQGLKTLKEDHNIIHRDVKPTNILVNGRGDVKLCDFGVSGNLVASIAKTNIGCQSYMAPERISSGGTQSVGGGASSTYGVQSDVWSLGLSIVECAVGSYPYPPETYNNIFSQLSAIVDGEPPDLPEDRFSPEARDFVRKCLHKIPSQRPSYATLLRHPWISDLTKPATISEHEEEDSEVVVPSSSDDDVVKEWVIDAMERRKAHLESGGKGPKKPALHAAPLDVVSPAQEKNIGPGVVEEVTNGVEALSAD